MEKHVRFVSVMNERLAYGGPEDGGWYYRDGRRVALLTVEASSAVVAEALAKSAADGIRADFDSANGRPEHLLATVLDESITVYVGATPMPEFPERTTETAPVHAPVAGKSVAA